MSAFSSELRSARAWLRGPEARLDDEREEHVGACVGFREEGEPRAPFAYPEITGYALCLWAWLHELEPDPVEQRAADRAIAWLARLLERLGAFPGVVPLRSDWIDERADHAYLFDAGIILSGLLRQHRVRGAPGARALAERVLAWMEPRLDREELWAAESWREPLQRVAATRWSRHAGPHLAKLALGLLASTRALGRACDAQRARALLERCLLFQRDDGRFLTDPLGDGTELHAQAYAIEGLWGGARVLEEPRFEEAAARGLRWMLQELESFERTGSADRSVTGHVRGDVRAQALRLGLLLGESTPLFAGTRELLRSRLLAHQLGEESGELAGAFAFHARDLRPRHANFWVTSFALQALMLDELQRRGSIESFDPLALI
ncbi:MAG: hypothetical protein IPN34_09685 [Planctomycetes bacterium]|nr:hypothetical protein [Planctomycetota bacterium]